ncbi:hypothetical protein KIW84_032470 [Lathyrus oleraceus]|uniref:Myb/SANT-like domain-containing protein n=1 Tax=Pisum sativum TaxID=3888 RepID=A0A9D4XY20_PEA|nr:hypothetical protein KIW84_032470 [Pisum sativum]
MATNVDISDSKLWSDFVTKAFIDIMVDEVTKGNMPNGVFHNRTWTSMTTKLNSITNQSFKARQLNAKMHRLWAMYHEFYSLLQNTRFGWDTETNTVTASEEVWINYLKVHDKASQFQKKGCDHYKLLEIIFNKNNAIGVLHHSSTQDPPNKDEENELDNQYLNNGSASHVCVDNDSSDDDLHEVEHITHSGKRQVQMEDIPHDAYGKALEKFMNPDWREVFIAMSVERKCGWVLTRIDIDENDDSTSDANDDEFAEFLFNSMIYNYHQKYFNKAKVLTSSLTGREFVAEVLNGSGTRWEGSAHDSKILLDVITLAT